MAANKESNSGIALIATMPPRLLQGVVAVFFLSGTPRNRMKLEAPADVLLKKNSLRSGVEVRGGFCNKQLRQRG